MPTCWASFTSCIGKTKDVVVKDVIPILNQLVMQARIVLTTLISAGVVKAEDPNVIEALDVLSKIGTGLDLSTVAAQKLIKYIPESLQNVGDLNKDGKINAQDLVMLLQDGEDVLKQLITGGLINSQQALLWQDFFNKLISALSNPSNPTALTMTLKQLNEKIATTGAVAVPIPNTSAKTPAQLAAENSVLSAKIDQKSRDLAKAHTANEQLTATLHQISSKSTASNGGVFASTASGGTRRRQIRQEDHQQPATYYYQTPNNG